MQKTLLLLLIFWLGFSQQVTSQNLQLKITGKDSLETIKIDSIGYQKKHKDFSSLQQAIDTLKFSLNKMGFINYEHDKILKINDSIFNTKITLNKPYKSIKIFYNNSLIDKGVLTDVSNTVEPDYFILEFSAIEPSLEYINLKTTENGFPFAELKLTNIKEDKGELTAFLKISNIQESRTIDKIIIQGYDKFPESFVKHYLKIKPGQKFNLTEVKKKTQVLNELQFANQVREPEVLFSKDSTILYLYVEKNKSNAFDGFLGFGTNEETNKFELNGYLDLQLVNNLNFGESFSLLYKSDENDLRTFDVKLFLPYIFKTPIGVEGQLNIFKKDSSFTTSNQNIRSFYQFNPKNRVSVGLKAIQSNNLLSTENSNTSIQDYKSNFYNVRYEFLLRQNKSRLYRTNALIDFEFGIGSRNSEGQSTNQYQYIFEALKNFNLNQKNSIYLRVKSNNLFSENYFENELFRFGGINSVRGFEENSLSATFYGLLNTEYRYLLDEALYVHSIIDVAYFENDITNQKEKLYSIGFGFGLLTKAGLFRFNYANGKSEDQNFKLSNSQIHISLSAFF